MEAASEGLKEKVAELTRKLEEAEAARLKAEGKLATAEEARQRASTGNWRLREVEKKLRGEADALRKQAEQLPHVKAKLTAVGDEARAMYATATATISTQAQAVRAAGDRVAILEAMLGKDLDGRTFPALLVLAAELLERTNFLGDKEIGVALRAKAGEVEAVQAPAQAPVLLTPAPETTLLQRLLALLEHEVLAETDYQSPDQARVAAGINQALLRVRDSLAKLAAGAAGYPFLSVTRSERWAVVFRLQAGGPEEAKVFAACERWGIRTNLPWPMPAWKFAPGETRPISIDSPDPAALERFRLELEAEGVRADAPKVAA